MTVEVFIDVVREGISTLITIIIPPLLVSLAVGLVISIFQAVTQIH
ncbi:MAG: flagellar biosynthetic protein FliQ, partial [Thermotoga sp.]